MSNVIDLTDLEHTQPHLAPDATCVCECHRCTIRVEDVPRCICQKCDADTCGLHEL